MIKGDSTLTLSEETVIAAIQAYLETTFATGKCPVVVAIEYEEENSGSALRQTTTAVYKLKLKEREQSNG